MRSMILRRGWQGVLFLVGGLALVGCVGRSLTTLPDMPLPPTSLAVVSGLPPASIIAVGGTQQLTASGLTFAGAAVTAFDSVLYRYVTAGDTMKVLVSNSGLVTGRVSTGASTVLLNVIGFKDGSIRGDQVVVQVTPTAVAGPLTFSIQPVAPDSAKLAAGSTKTIIPVLWNPTTGITVATPAVKYTIKGTDSVRVGVYRKKISYLPNPMNAIDAIVVKAPNTASASLAPNQFTVLSGEGTAWLYATISAYGMLLQDSVQYTFSYPYIQTIPTAKTNLAVTNNYAGQIVTLAPGATVTFQNAVATTDPLTMTYTFDAPALATAASPASTVGGATGNVTTLTGGQASSRRFLTPGTIHWTMTPFGGPAPWPGQTLSGTIVIK